MMALNPISWLTTKLSQYVRGVQEDKLRLIHQSLSSVEVSRPEKDERRRQVRGSHRCGWQFLGLVVC